MNLTSAEAEDDKSKLKESYEKLKQEIKNYFTQLFIEEINFN